MDFKKNLKPNKNDINMSQLTEKFQKTVNAYIPGTCPLAQQLAMLQASMSISCKKCIPCRDGLEQAEILLKQILSTNADIDTFNKLKNLATTIKNTADCAIGYDAANNILLGMDLFNDEYMEHINNSNCSAYDLDCAPCVSFCPANVDIPAYISLIKNKNYVDAVRVIRNDNPFPTTCAYICEHPCEAHCRRNILDSEINIKGLKRYAVDNANADSLKPAKKNENTLRNIAVVGGGPSGLTAAYYLALMGHNVTIFEAQSKLGGMLQYGIPNYRLPKKRLAQDIKMILSLDNIKVKFNHKIENDKDFEKLQTSYDAVYLAIGAQLGKKLNLPGIENKGVVSAVDMLGQVGQGKNPNYKGKKVVVIGGGNVAMDAARTAVRCGAKKVSVVYRRRKDDMTALDSEILSTIEEGVELLTLYAPKEIKANKSKNVTKVVLSPQMISGYGSQTRPRPIDAKKEDVELKCDIVLLAIGQDIDSQNFKKIHTDEKRKVFITNKQQSTNFENVFAGGDCVDGPATVIKAVAAGKSAAINIDNFLGYHHRFKEKIEVPKATQNNRELYGRVNINEVAPDIRKSNFDEVELCMSEEEAMQECSKCLRCDHFGCNTVESARKC